jgi:hypothetical protein
MASAAIAGVQGRKFICAATLTLGCQDFPFFKRFIPFFYYSLIFNDFLHIMTIPFRRAAPQQR